MGELGKEMNTEATTLGSVIRRAFRSSVTDYFRPLTLASQFCSELYRAVLPVLATALRTIRSLEPDSETLSSKQQWLEQTLQCTIQQILNQEVSYKHLLLEARQESFDQLDKLLRSSAFALTKTRQQELQEEIEQRRAIARERIELLDQKLDENAKLENTLRKSLGLKRLHRWELEKAIDWTQGQVKELQQELEKVRAESRQFEGDFEQARLFVENVRDKFERIWIQASEAERIDKIKVFAELLLQYVPGSFIALLEKYAPFSFPMIHVAERTVWWAGGDISPLGGHGPHLSPEQKREWVEKYIQALPEIVETKLKQSREREQTVLRDVDLTLERLKLLKWGLGRVIER
jgi:hypothetical protein